MGLSTILKAKARQAKSNNYAGRLRAEGFLPVVFYGPGLDAALSLSLDYKEFKTAMLTSEGNRSLYTLEIEGVGSEVVLLKDYQINPLSRKVVHADFYKIDPSKPVTLTIPVILSGKPAGAEAGGQLQYGSREITITALPKDVPAEIEVNVSSLGLGESIHFSQITPPENVQLAYSTDLPVATVAIPKGMKTEEEEGADGPKKADAKG